MITHPQVVGAAGFEPATSWSQTRRDDRTTLRPERFIFNIYFSTERDQYLFSFYSGETFSSTHVNFAVGARFELAVQLPVRQFSKLLVSASHPSHRY